MGRDDPCRSLPAHPASRTAASRDATVATTTGGSNG